MPTPTEENPRMDIRSLHVLVVGATGSIGRLVVDEALRAGHAVRALVRNPARTTGWPAGAEIVPGDLTRPESLPAAADGIDAIVFTHGTDGLGKTGAEQVDYGGVRNLLTVLAGREVRIVLMTAIGVTNRTGAYNLATEAHDWKRRSERLVRASGLPYTIVRPGWFDHHGANQHRLLLLQGDRRCAGDPSDGVVARRQIAAVLVRSLTSSAARRKTFELVAEQGAQQTDFDLLFSALEADRPDALDACRDTADMPLGCEPEAVREDLARLARQPLP
jgi:uncharacterized protein YbjT (DUF2867 family)